MPASPNIITRDNFTWQQVPPPNNTAVGWGFWDVGAAVIKLSNPFIVFVD